jgi:predicted RNase H-like HicB family nuclease
MKSLLVLFFRKEQSWSKTGLLIKVRSMTTMSILVRADWDPEAEVFVATSDDVPGLVAEAATPAELSRKLAVLVPELLELNRDHAIPQMG